MAVDTEEVKPQPWKQNTYTTESSAGLLKFRLFFYSASLIHIAWLAAILLPMDVSSSTEKQLLDMSKVKQLLYTTWTNYFQVIYFLISLYVDWKELKGEHLTSLIQKLQTIRNFFFTSIVLPSTMYTGCFFWRMWHIDRDMMVPASLDEFLPQWMNHNLHTVTVIVCFVDLFLVPRYKPRSNNKDIDAIKILCTLYCCLMLLTHDASGIWAYPFFRKLTPWRIVVYVASFYVEHLFFYHSQWPIIESVWRTTSTHKEHCSANGYAKKIDNSM